MRTYKVRDSQVVASDGAGDVVVIHDVSTVSPAIVAEVLQHAFEAGRTSMLVEIQHDLADKRNGWPKEASSWLRNNVRPETEEVYNKR